MKLRMGFRSMKLGQAHMPKCVRLAGIPNHAFGTDDPLPEGFVKQLAYPLQPARLRGAVAGRTVSAPDAI